MNTILKKLAKDIRKSNPEISDRILVLAGRYDKSRVSTPPEIQHSFKYIMYLKLIRGLDDETFHSMKRKYLNTSPQIQEEARQELDKLVREDALASNFTSSEIMRRFNESLWRVNWRELV